MTAPSIRYARSGGASIAYMVGGSGPLDLLLIPGFVSHLDVSVSSPPARRFWDRLCSFARVITFDKRGQGLSDAGAYTLENVAADALAVLDAVGVERVSILGISEGGGASTMLAATHPDRVGAMVQYGTWARIGWAEDYPQGLAEDEIERRWTSLTRDWGEAGSLEAFAPDSAGDPDLRDWWARMLRSGASPAALEAIGRMYRTGDVRPLLGSVSVPTLVLWRAGDRVIPPELSRAVADGIPGSRRIELPGNDHLFVAGDQAAILDPTQEFLTGTRPTPAGARVLATVLFADLVDSTVRAAELGDGAWRGLLERCGEIWRAETERQGGRLVKSTGDGVLATFDGPTAASSCALAMASRIEGEVGLRSRAGIHTGECELIGDDVGGIAVHIASRVEGRAGPGEVYATRTVRDLSIGSALSFEPREVSGLKGVPGEWELYAVAAS